MAWKRRYQLGCQCANPWIDKGFFRVHITLGKVWNRTTSTELTRRRLGLV